MEVNMNTGKDSKWFPHDSDALDDPKIMLLVMQLGMEGYGLYWMLIEKLLKQPGYLLPVVLIEPLSRRYQVSKEKLDTIIFKYGLFEQVDDSFLSPSLQRRMQVYERRTEINKKNALKRWDCNRNAIAMQSQSDCNAIREDKIREDKIREDKIREDKIREDKKEKNVIPPLFDWIEIYCKERNNSVDAKQFFDFYESKGWKIGKDKMKDWQAAVRTWEQRAEKQAPEVSRTNVEADIMNFMHPKIKTDGQK
jgi:hypothetical protein